MRAEPGSGSDLPAPYRNPWRLLARDLRAVASSLALKLRELWRRNGEGDLWMPPFWPRSLAALFWPALLTALLVLVLLLTGLHPGSWPLPTRPPHSSAPPPSASAGSPQPPAEAPPAAESHSTPAMPGAEAGAGRTTSLPRPLETPPAPPPEPVDDPVPEPDPLLVQLGQGEPDPLVLSALADPARSQLALRLDAAFGSLSTAERQARAQRWWQRSQELGFEHLELRDGGGRLLGRTALVGSGMILLESTPTE